MGRWFSTFLDNTTSNNLVYVPGLDGVILKPQFPALDQTFYESYKNDGTVAVNISDNDPWGYYYELHPELATGGVASVQISTRNMYQPIGIRVKRYEPIAGSTYSTTDKTKSPCTRIFFGKNYELFTPFHGAPVLRRLNNKNSTWYDVKTIEAQESKETADYSADYIVMYLDGKLVITSDNFATTTIQEIDENEADHIFDNSKIVVSQRGAIAHISVRYLSYARYGFFTSVGRSPQLKLKGTPAQNADVDLSVRGVQLSGYFRTSTDTTGVKHSSLEVTRLNHMRKSEYNWFENKWDYEVDNSILDYKVEFYGNGSNTPILYGVAMKQDALSTPATPLDQYVDLTSDVFDIELDCPGEEDQAKASISIGSVRVTEDTETKLKFAQTITTAQGDGFKGISNYMFASVRLGFVADVDGDHVWPTSDAHPDYNTYYTGSGWHREFYGLIKNLNVRSGESVGVSFDICSAADQMKEVLCDGEWGPYDSMYIVEVLRQLLLESGIPSNRFYIKGPYTLNSDGTNGTVDLGWIPVDTVISYIEEPEHVIEMIGTVADNMSDWAKQLKRLDTTPGKESKWTPRLGDNVWNIAQWVAAYEKGKFWISDDMCAYYDPYYYDEIYPLVADYGELDTISGRVKNFTPRVRTVALTIQNQEETQEDYGVYHDITASLDPEGTMGSIIVAGLKMVEGNKTIIVAYLKNKDSTDPTKAMFIPFPKRSFVGNPAWSDEALIAGLCGKIAQRGFQICRLFNIETYGHAYVKNRDGLSLHDELTANNYYVEVESSHHSWHSKDNVAWAKSSFSGRHFGYTDLDSNNQVVVKNMYGVDS